MKNIVKIRNLDSLNKLSISRSKGKILNLEKRKLELNQAMLTLDKCDLLSDDLLLRLSKISRLIAIEIYKLERNITNKRNRKDNSELVISPHYHQCGLSLYSNIPYEVSYKRTMLISKFDIDLELELKNRKIIEIRNSKLKKIYS